MIVRSWVTLALLLVAINASAAEQNQPPEGFTALFDGKTLDGWWGLGTEHYKNYANLSPKDLAKRQEKSREGNTVSSAWAPQSPTLMPFWHQG